MFGIGLNEMLLLAIIGLLVIGPERLPGAARKLGQFLTQLRRTSNELRQAVHTELSKHEDLEGMRELKSAGQEAQQGLRALRDGVVEGMERELDKTTDPAAADPSAAERLGEGTAGEEASIAGGEAGPYPLPQSWEPPPEAEQVATVTPVAPSSAPSPVADSAGVSVAEPPVVASSAETTTSSPAVASPSSTEEGKGRTDA